MNDTWINWGDFIEKNKGQLDAYDAKVLASQAEQQAAMQAGLDRLSSDYAKAAGAKEDEYAKATEDLYEATRNPYRSGPTSMAPTQGRPGKGAPIGQVATGPQPKAEAPGQFAFTPDTQSYSALMAAQNNAQANAFTGYQSPSAPGWQNALYSKQAQYVDPWKQLQSKIDPITSEYKRRATAAQEKYDSVAADLAEQKANWHQEDTGPRNVSGYTQKKPLEGVVGYA